MKSYKSLIEGKHEIDINKSVENLINYSHEDSQLLKKIIKEIEADIFEKKVLLKHIDAYIQIISRLRKHLSKPEVEITQLDDGFSMSLSQYNPHILGKIFEYLMKLHDIDVNTHKKSVEFKRIL